MKKLYVITENYPYTRGELPFLEPELAELKKHFDITVLCKSHKKQPEYTLPEGIKLLHFDVAGFSTGERLGEILRCPFSAEYYSELFDRKNPGTGFRRKESDIRGMRLLARRLLRYMEGAGLFDDPQNTLFYSYWCNDTVLALSWAKRKHKHLKMVTRMTGYDLYNMRCRGGRQPHKRVADRYLDKAFFISAEGRSYYETHFSERAGLPRPLCYLGVDDNGLARRSSDGVFRLFSCANLIPLKRVELIIEALALLRGENIEWVHAGGGSEEQMLRSLALEKLDGSSVRYEMLGSVPNPRVLEQYKEHGVDCFITSTQMEGAPVSIMESLSFGVPVIATAVNGIPEMVEDGVSGYLLSPNPTPQEIAGRIKKMMSLCERKRNEMCVSARTMWENKFNAPNNYKKFAAELLQLFEGYENE